MVVPESPWQLSDNVLLLLVLIAFMVTRQQQTLGITGDHLGLCMHEMKL